MNESPSRGVATQINPEAGQHVVSLDPAELEAAERATARSWREFPYYGQRYGKRGWKFSLSDSGWLQTLRDLDPVAAREQALWLATLLAARGMPSLLLERHLGFLLEELKAASSASAPGHAVLAHCAAAIRERRLTGLGEAELDEIARGFDAAVADLERPVERLGVVLAAAVADEASQLCAGAVDAVLAWAADESAFGAAWCAAVRNCVSAARRRSACR